MRDDCSTSDGGWASLMEGPNWRVGWWQNRSASGSQRFPVAPSGAALHIASDLEKEC